VVGHTSFRKTNGETGDALLTLFFEDRAGILRALSSPSLSHTVEVPSTIGASAADRRLPKNRTLLIGYNATFLIRTEKRRLLTILLIMVRVRDPAGSHR
jgi:hypothetical protein